MAEGLNLKNTAIDLGWERSPYSEESSRIAEELHQRAYAPAVETVMKAASPQSTPEDRVEAANIFKQSNEARIGDVLQSIANLNFRDLYIALTGGSSKPEIGFDGAGNQYEVMYNQRGERRSIRDLRTNKLLDDKALNDVGGITTRVDVTPERQAQFKAAQYTVQQVAQARANDLVNTEQAASQAGAWGRAIRDWGEQNSAISKRLAPASLSGDQLAFIKGISSIRTGDQQATKSMVDKLKEYQKGDKEEKGLTNSEKEQIGAQFGLYYHKGKGWVDNKNNVASSSDIDKVTKNYESSQSSDKAVETRQNEMLQRAQILFAGTEGVTDITALINNNAKIALAQNKIQEFGGINVANPNLPHELGNTFMSARQKALSDEFYGASAEAFARFMKEKRATMRPGASPDIGEWRAEFANSEYMNNLRREFAAKSRVVEDENKIITKKVDERKLLTNLTNEANRQGVPAPEGIPVNNAPAGARPPAATTPAAAPTESAPQSRMAALRAQRAAAQQGAR